ncbi:MAG: hypothetical protein JETT_1404 [Candidatus Jettenia ecosi]|uniref:Uncharacterized protein n=1 Tax=Candidatus Jettenia ecosi TaxID=2494326 RepID=A0A533QCU8_9BACT|nr:MAG: hypothetical protein JETT_1404 [Candidatus Jettenia ecosi]
MIHKYRIYNILYSAFLLFLPSGVGIGETLESKDKIHAQMLWRYITRENP